MAGSQWPETENGFCPFFSTAAQYRWFVVVLAWAAHFTYYVIYSSIGIMGPVLKIDMNLSNTQFGILCGAIGVGTTLAQIPAGIWCDRLGVRSVMTVAFIFIAILTFVFSLGSGFAIPALVLLGIGLAVGCSQIAAAKAVIDWFPYAGRATAMGIKQTGINIGGIVGSVVLPMLLGLYGWRLLYKTMGGLALLFGVCFWLLFRDILNARKDFAAQSDGLGLKNALVSLKDTRFLCVTAAGVFLLIVQFAFSSYLILYLNQGVHYTLKVSGFVLALSFAVGAIGRVGWGVVSDYIIKSRETTLAIVALLGTASIIALAVITPSTPVWFLYLLAIFLGVTVMGWFGIWLALVGELSQGKSTGLGLGLSLFFANLGLLLGPPLFGILTDIFKSFSVAWFFIAFCMGIASPLMLVGKRSPAGTREDA
ncbi:MAG: Hexuronate transporter [Syntrophorhabdus sp. PtaU1.Bin058]|nr:MAG: Hexuronate transporter [Syntrophorhabdus sp. PtaU1.Bin058]